MFQNTDSEEEHIGPLQFGEGVFSDCRLSLSGFGGINAGFGGLSGLPYRISGGVQGELNKNYADAGYYNGNPCGYSGNFSPICHLPLGLKIALGAPIGALGFWIGWRGLNAADWRNPRFSHTVWCAVRLLAGGAIATFGLLIMVL